MKQNGSFQETIARIGQKLRSSRKRYFGVLLILLGIVLGIVSRAAGGSPSQDFTSGILMGLSLGFLLSCCLSSGDDDILDKVSGLLKLHAEATAKGDPISTQVV